MVTPVEALTRPSVDRSSAHELLSRYGDALEQRADVKMKMFSLIIFAWPCDSDASG